MRKLWLVLTCLNSRFRSACCTTLHLSMLISKVQESCLFYYNEHLCMHVNMWVMIFSCGSKMCPKYLHMMFIEMWI